MQGNSGASCDDLRAPIISLTEIGLSTIRAAAPAHVAHVRTLFCNALTPAQAEAVREAADAVLDNLARHAAPETPADE